MSALGNKAEGELLRNILQAVPLPWAAATQFFLSLHTADPGEVGTQATSEASYTGYARIPIQRNTTDFTATGDDTTGWQIANSSLLQFGLCTAGSANATHVSIGLAASGATQIIEKTALSATLAISNGIRPQFAAGAIVFTLD